MSFQFKVNVGGFNFMFGNDLHDNVGLFLDFGDPEIIHSIMHREKNFYDALVSAVEESKLWESQHLMEQFEYYYLQGHGYESIYTHYNFKTLSDFKDKAELILDHEDASDYQRQVAQKIINTLNGNPPHRIYPEKSPEEKEKQKFDKKKPKLKLKLVIRDGYKCDICSESKEDSLCIIKKDKNNISYELENLVLRCRKCLRKNK